MPITVLADGTASTSSMATALETFSGAANPRQNCGLRKIPRLMAAGAEEAYAMPAVLQAGRSAPTGTSVQDLIGLWDSPERVGAATSSSSSRPTVEATTSPSLLSLFLRRLCRHSQCRARAHGGGGVSPNLP